MHPLASVSAGLCTCANMAQLLLDKPRGPLGHDVHWSRRWHRTAWNKVKRHDGSDNQCSGNQWCLWRWTMVRIPFPAACLRLRGPYQGWNCAVEPWGTDYGEDGIVSPASSLLNGPVVLPEIAAAVHTHHARVGDADSEVVFLIVTTRRAATSPVLTGVAHDPRLLGVCAWVLHGPDVLANLVLRCCNRFLRIRHTPDGKEDKGQC